MGQSGLKSAKEVLRNDSNKNKMNWEDMNIPEDILWEVLIRVPAKDIVKSCARVCKQWHYIIESKHFWIQKCSEKHQYSRELIQILADDDFKKLYFRSPYQTNLILNPCAEKGLDDWVINRRGGNGWKCEEPCGCDPIVNYTYDNQNKDIKCWVTSYHECTKSQTIDLLARGCSKYILDVVKPDICISEWYAGRFDCSMKYILNVKLLGEKKGNSLKAWSHIDEKPAGRDWFKAQHTFTDYPSGVRFIEYSHTGVDGQFWAGWYGAKMTLSTVKLDFTHTFKKMVDKTGSSAESENQSGPSV
ncbi:F-box associated region [Mactra antiquata]